MLTTKRKGFTLIEIVIVLAIAALILVIVFLAVGGAQRAQRDRANQDAAGKVLASLAQYAADNGGSYPTAGTSVGTYIGTTTDSAGVAPKDTTTAATTTATNTKRIVYSGNAICSGATVSTASPAGATNGAVSYWSEAKSGAVCKDNK